jgi:2',3'-cyclic-nucleotide 2'-phosphodiesterase (5'-nucleotidase family)
VHKRLILWLLWLGAALPGHVAEAIPAKPAEPASCVILATNDSESNFDGRRLADGQFLQTIARVAARKRAIAAERGAGSVLLVEGGDILQGRYMERQDGDGERARHEALRIYRLAGYDAMTLGNHEFDAGPKVPEQMLRGSHGPPVVDANIASQWIHDGQPRSSARTIRTTCGGLDVVLTGALTPDTATISAIGSWPIEAPAKAVREALQPYPDAVHVVLSHLGKQDDLQLARDVTAVDLIIGGHSHTVMPEVVRVGRTHVGQAGSRFQFLAVWTLTRSDGGLKVDYRLEPIDERMPKDSAVSAAVDQLRETLVPEVVIGERRTHWDVMHAGRSDYARMATRAVWQFAGKASGHPVDAALLNVGGFRSATIYPPGPVTNVDVQAIHPFKNRIVLVQLTGAQLQHAIENTCTTGHAEGHGRDLVGWGLSFTCDVAKPMIRYEVRGHVPVAVRTPGQRATVMVGGKPLAPQANYTIATLDYLAKGGSGYFGLTLGQRRCSDGTAFEPAVGCPQSPLLSQVIEQAVRDGTLEAPF